MEEYIRNILIPALVPETGEHIQLHCCRNSICPNFHIDALYQGGDGEWKLSRNYSIKQGEGDTKKYISSSKNWKDRGVTVKIPGWVLHCKLCRSTLPIRSNQGVATVAGAILSAKLPLNFCDTLGCPNSSGLYQGNSATQKYQKFGKNSSGTPRYRCAACGKTSSPVRRAPRDYRDISKDASRWATRFQLLLEVGPRGYVRVGKDEEIKDHVNDLKKYEYLAEQWIKIINRAVAAGKADILAATQAEKYEHPFVEVKTDILGVSVATPGEEDKRVEINVILSVLKPSNFILLSSMDFDSEVNMYEILENRELAESENPGIYRESIPNPQLSQFGDYTPSPDSAKGRTNPHYFFQGAKIRKSYALLAHFYALRHILAGIKQPLVHCMDNEPGLASACIWAFKKKIAQGNCHVITLKRTDIDSSAPEMEIKARDSADKLAEQFKGKNLSAKEMEYQKILSRTVDYREKYFTALRQKGLASHSKIYKEGAITSDLYSQPEGLRELRYMSETGQLQDEDLAHILQAAMLKQVDSVMTQIRDRVPRATRGQRPAHSRGLSYAKHFHNPTTLYWLINAFTFSKNCVSNHSDEAGYIPPAVKLGIIPPGQKLTNFCRKDWGDVVGELYST